jgi:hypothetical protein
MVVLEQQQTTHNRMCNESVTYLVTILKSEKNQVFLENKCHAFPVA